MARPLRIEYRRATYYITSRGNAKQKIVRDDNDRSIFLETLGFVIERFSWICHAYCLMDNHYHLLIETPKPNLSKGMRQFNGIYTQNFNRSHGRAGHVFQGRFKAILVDKDNYLLELCRYIVLNPVRLRRFKSSRAYKWSSYNATAGIAKPPDFLTTDWIYSQFYRRKKTAQERYRKFVKEGVGKASPLKNVRGQVLLGDEKFLKKLMPLLKDRIKERGIKRELDLKRPSLDQLFKTTNLSKARRDKKIKEAHIKHGYTLTEIADKVNLHYSTLSRIINKD
ncbi:transposase [Desulfobacterota bacterium AH_259_B03_O07]|nr:transposase [Desulfobacterota bacterium AH_259_B03_O07]